MSDASSNVFCDTAIVAGRGRGQRQWNREKGFAVRVALDRQGEATVRHRVGRVPYNGVCKAGRAIAVVCAIEEGPDSIGQDSG